MIQPVIIEIGSGLLQLVRMFNYTFVYLTHDLSQVNMIRAHNISRYGYHNYKLYPQNQSINEIHNGTNLNNLNNLNSRRHLFHMNVRWKKH